MPPLAWHMSMEYHLGTSATDIPQKHEVLHKRIGTLKKGSSAWAGQSGSICTKGKASAPICIGGGGKKSVRLVSVACRMKPELHGPRVASEDGVQGVLCLQCHGQ